MHFVILCFLAVVLQQFCTFLSTEFFKSRKQFELLPSVDPSSASCVAAQFASLSLSHHAVTWLCHFCIPPSLRCTCPAPSRSCCLCPARTVLGTWRACCPSLPPSLPPPLLKVLVGGISFLSCTRLSPQAPLPHPLPSLCWTLSLVCTWLLRRH